MEQRRIFLIGGNDLEMQEIKKILASTQGILFFDASLEWHNAKLSAYEPILRQYENDSETLIYGIELHETDDFQPPSNYHRIDHHNHLSHLPASIEQVATILNVALTREQKLIAANDRGYIPEMQRSGASAEEIRQIRLRDRMAQGVTEKDEQLAERAIQNKTIEQGFLIVKSESNRFSPICDRLFPYEKLLIYTEDELMYYGKGKNRLVDYYDTEIKSCKMFHGGSAEGFFGTARNAYPYAELLSIKETIIQIINK